MGRLAETLTRVFALAPGRDERFFDPLVDRHISRLRVRNATGDWVDVPILPDTFIVNIGDLLARWTNDEWVSTLHRVANPPAGAGAASRRQSLVFFHNPNYDALIESLVEGAPKYPPTTSGAHLARLFAATQNPVAAAAR